MTLKEIYGANLRHYRKAAQLTQADLAEKVDMSRETITRLERGAVAPSFETMELMSKILEAPEAAFLGSAPLTLPRGERGRLLQRINQQLSKLNETQLAQASKMLESFEIR